MKRSFSGGRVIQRSEARMYMRGFVGMATVFFCSTFAFGHAMLDHASPKVGSTVDTCPPRVVLHFSQEIEPAFSTLRVLDVAGKQVDNADAVVDPNDQSTFSVSIPKLAAGIYTVEWKVTSVDTHRTHGAFTFTLAPKG